MKKTRLRVERIALKNARELRNKGDTASISRAAALEKWIAGGVKFDVVAHSMGGLIARYYLRFGETVLPPSGQTPPVTWAGSKEIDRLFLVGTPNLGSMNALQELTEGFHPSALLPDFHPSILGTMPSTYQLLPHGVATTVFDTDGSAVDIFDVEEWTRHGWGLMSKKNERMLKWLMPGEKNQTTRRQRAKKTLSAHLAQARQFHAAIDQETSTASPTEIRLFAGDSMPTSTYARIKKDGSLRFDGADLFTPGDSTVARYSAVADLSFGEQGKKNGWIRSPIPWISVTFLVDDHIGITSNPNFINNLLHQLIGVRPRGL